MTYTKQLTQWCLAAITLPMAQTSQVEGRLIAVLQKERSRTMLTRKANLLALTVTTAAILPLAVLHPVVRAQGETPPLPPSAAAPQAATAVTAPIDPQAQAVLTQAAAATAALHSFQADMTWTTHQPGKTASAHVQLWASRPNLARVMVGSQMSMVADRDDIWNSIGPHKDSKWLNSPHGHAIGSFSSSPFLNYFFGPSLAGLTAFADSGTPTVHYVGERVWQGTHYQVISLQRQKLFPHTILAYFGPDHLLHRVIVTMPFKGLTQVQEMTLMHLTLNPTLPPALFRFTPSPATMVEDHTVMQRYLDKRIKQQEQEQKS